MVVKLRKIVDTSSPFYTEKGYLDAVIRRNTNILKGIHEHGLRLVQILAGVNNRRFRIVDYIQTTRMETHLWGRNYRWSDWTYRIINRYLYSLEKGFAAIDLSFKGDFKKKPELFVRPYMPLERDVYSQDRLERYLELFQCLQDKSYLEFIKKAHRVRCEPVKSNLRLKF